MTPKKITHKNVIDLIVRKLDDGKAENIQVYDVRAVSGFTDDMIVATGTSTRHVLSLAHHLEDDLKEKGISPVSDSGRGDGHWAIVDLGAILVHIMTQEARLNYDLDSLWNQPKSKRTRKAPRKISEKTRLKR